MSQDSRSAMLIRTAGDRGVLYALHFYTCNNTSLRQYVTSSNNTFSLLRARVFFWEELTDYLTNPVTHLKAFWYSFKSKYRLQETKSCVELKTVGPIERSSSCQSTIGAVTKALFTLKHALASSLINIHKLIKCSKGILQGLFSSFDFAFFKV